MRKKIKIIIVAITLIFAFSSVTEAQNLLYDTTVIRVPKPPTEHLIGLQYSYSISNTSFVPDYKPTGSHSPMNFALLYTYYHPLWHLNFFGFRTGIMYNSYGITTEYSSDYLSQKYNTIQLPVTSCFKANIGKHFRIIMNIGTYLGYRYNSNKIGGYDCYDKRFDYGISGGGGIALKFKPIEIQFECTYQYSLSWLYHPAKMSDNYWIYSYPTIILISVGLNYHLF